MSKIIWPLPSSCESSGDAAILTLAIDMSPFLMLLSGLFYTVRNLTFSGNTGATLTLFSGAGSSFTGFALFFCIRFWPLSLAVLETSEVMKFGLWKQILVLFFMRLKPYLSIKRTKEGKCLEFVKICGSIRRVNYF